MKATEEKQLAKGESKKSQEGIIVTILLILIAIAAVTVLAMWKIPMIKNNLAASNININIYIDKGSTFYNDRAGDWDCGGLYNCVKEPRTYVKVVRGADNAELYAIKFVFTKGTKTYMYLNTNVPQEIESRIYSFMLYGENKSDYVEIAPVVLVNGKQKTLPASEKADLRTSDAIISRDYLEMCSIPLASSSGEIPPEPIAADCQQ